jgi:hypothetical protein
MQYGGSFFISKSSAGPAAVLLMDKKPKPLWLRAHLILAAALCSSSFFCQALAHTGSPEGRSPFLSNHTLTGGGTTWGIIHQSNQQWHRVCEETLNAPPSFHHQNVHGRILIGTESGLLATDDFGCSFTQVSEQLSNQNVSSIGVPLSHPEKIYVATSSPQGANGVYKSDDHGTTFHATGLQGLPSFILSLLVNHDGSQIYVSTYDASLQSTQLFYSNDEGVTFVESNIIPEDAIYLTLIGIDHEHDRVALSTVTNIPGGRLYFSNATLDSLVFDSAFETVPTQYAAFNGKEFLLLAFTELRTRSLEDADAGFMHIEDGAARCILRLPFDDRLWRCGFSNQSGHFSSTSDGETWENHIPFLDVLEYRCPEGTTGYERCAYLFADGGVRDGGDVYREGGMAGEDSGIILDAGILSRVDAAVPPNEAGNASSCSCLETLPGLPRDQNHFALLVFLLLGTGNLLLTKRPLAQHKRND